LLLRAPAALRRRDRRRPAHPPRPGDRLRRRHRQRLAGCAAPALRDLRARPGAPLVGGRGGQPLPDPARGSAAAMTKRKGRRSALSGRGGAAARRPPARPQRPLAASTTASVVMLKYLYSSLAGAEAPKRSRPITAPSRPTYLRQKSVMPASTATRLRTALGSTDSRYAASWRSNTSVEGIDTTRVLSPAASSCALASIASDTSEPVPSRITSGLPPCASAST